MFSKMEVAFWKKGRKEAENMAGVDGNGNKFIYIDYCFWPQESHVRKV